MTKYAIREYNGLFHSWQLCEIYYVNFEKKYKQIKTFVNNQEAYNYLSKILGRSVNVWNDIE